MSWDPSDAHAPTWLPLYPPPPPAPDPSWAPPRVPLPRRLARLIPSVVVVLALLASGAAVAGAVRTPAVFDDYLPPDGLGWVADRDGRAVQIEQALLRPAALGTASSLGRLLGPPHASSRYLRLSVNGALETEVLVEASGTDLRLVGLRTERRAATFTPGIQLARSARDAVIAGRGTVRTGDQPDPEAYESEVVSGLGQGGCLELNIVVTALNRTTGLEIGLCPGRGLSQVVWSADNVVQLELTPAAPGTSAEITTTPSVSATQRSWTGHASWQPSALAAVSDDPLGSVNRPLTPQAGPAQLIAQLLVPDSTSRDLEAYERVGNQLRLRWRTHPGGDIVAVAAVGDLVVAALADRRLVAYYDGVRRWETTEVTETIAGEPAAVTGALTFATLDGSVWRLDAITGRVLWRQSIGAPVNLDVVADDRVVLAADTAGGIHGFVPTGQQVFNGQVAEPFTGIAIDENTVYLARGRTIEGYDIQRSQFLWDQVLPTTTTGICATGTGLVAATAETTYGLTPTTGEPIWQLPGATDLVCASDAVALLGPDQLAVAGADGQDLRTVALAGTSNFAIRALVPDATEVSVIAPGVAVRLGQ